MPSSPSSRPAAIVATACALFATLAPGTARGSFHLMQIEQAIGGVCGDVGDQAVQLRMRADFQNFVQGTRLVARDAAGANPVTLITFPGNVAGSGTGLRILAATSDFPGGPTPDFVLTNRIPAAYLPAGKLTFEDSLGNIYWGLAWGGAAYTGTNLGSLENDANGNFNPPFAGVMPWSTAQAVLFSGSATAQSTSNANDYDFTSGQATFTNNSAGSGQPPDCIFGDGFETGTDEAWPSAP